MDASPPPARFDPARFAVARNAMVDSQVRPNKVTDPALLEAMRTLPREAFLPEALLARAYSDEDVPLGGGRVLMEPMVIARLIQVASVRPRERALVVGCGPGYGSALLAAMGLSVVALEQDPALAEVARRVLGRLAPGVRVVEAPLADGHGAGAPYDLILIEGAVRAIPDAYAAQLRPAAGSDAPSGSGPARCVGVIAGLRSGVAVLAEAVGVSLRARAAFDCATPPIPALLPPPVFEF